MAILDSITSKSAVSNMSVIDAVLAGGVGAVSNVIVTSFLPSANPFIVGGAEIGIGMISDSVIGGKAGKILSNGLIITGAIHVSNALMSMFFGGNSSTADTGNSAVVF